ncbi:TOTE conflict system archaeo-eukaryotic primase domain-containing protein [Alkalibacterium kapii]|uniref:Helicase n=1 Tax=Alkalibacterium kapii TaxID=426704 RepID=A0A511AS08_9LACT|nr:DEAD/DEAH box helicase family protein [Alkalibacterium kapii]GEK90984.1 helicase [Alkalibacterium kapii]
MTFNRDYYEKKIQELTTENKKLKRKIHKLEEELQSSQSSDVIEETVSELSGEPLEIKHKQKESSSKQASGIDKYAAPTEKIKLYHSLFKGRTDAYAEKFIHSKTGKPGYAPKKLPFWERTDDNTYAPYTPEVIREHLLGNLIAGVFPITTDDTCYFLAIDLDGENWNEDVKALREVCSTFGIPMSVERSQSGNGAHCWVFFQTEVMASTARKLGSELIRQAMTKRHELDFASFDRLFPNQDTVPKGGLGNLIALPLQKQARANGNSLFIDTHFQPIEDQWAYLSSIEKVSSEQLAVFIEKLKEENGEISLSDRNESRPPIESRDFPKTVHIKLSNMVYIKKEGISSKGLSHLKWMAAFFNPEFYQLQAMRRSTYRVQRVISCHEETSDHLLLPRGLKEKVITLLESLRINVIVEDERNQGNHIPVKFTGILRPQQQEAVTRLLEHDTGILCGSTAFGKTVAAINLIAEKEVNTLVLVNKVSLATQWRKRIDEFLEWPESESAKSFVGQLGGGKKTLTNKIDVALLQSLYRKGTVNECVKNYGMIIVDECHHISAFSFESVLKQANPKHVYGLTATPRRKDGHQPIIYMQCGDIRYQDDAKKQAEKRPFSHTLVTRFTPLDQSIKEGDNLQDLYSDLINNDNRNRLIVEDVLENAKEKRYSLILTERIEHIKILKALLEEELDNVFVLSGNQGKKKNNEVMEKLEAHESDVPFVIISTGKYIGEGFDDSRLDSLFLAMPFSWKGRLQQYAGRLHRLHEGKSDVRVYDYADIHLPVLERMYQKRLKGYASMGYELKSDNQENSRQAIYGTDDYYDALLTDLKGSKENVLVSSPSLSYKQLNKMLNNLVELDTDVNIMTKSASEIKSTKHRESKERLIDELEKTRLTVKAQENIFHRFVIIDSYIIWYGSIDVLGRQSSEGTFMRIESPVLAKEMEELV